MILTPPRTSRGACWLAVALWSGLIFTTIPLARAIERLVAGSVGRGAFLAFVLACGAAAAAWAVAALQREAQLDVRRGSALAAVAFVYAWGAWSLRDNPEEAVHFVQYGVLGVLAFVALSHRVRDPSLYASAAGVGVSVGILDEVLQWLTPNRYWDLRDIGLNAAGASLAQLGLALGVAPRWVRPPVTARGAGTLAAVALVAWTLLGTNLLLTPPRIAAAERALGLALPGAEVMLEYGHLHEVPGVGRFRSRFTLEELVALDRARADQAGATLAAHGADEDYQAFLARHSPFGDPFLHELRVHLFRRDRYRETGERHLAEGDEHWARGDFTVAYREDRFLEMGFGETLRRSGRDWPPEERARMARLQFAERDYESRVSENLVTALSEAQVAGAFAAGWIALALAWWAAARRAGPAPPS